VRGRIEFAEAHAVHRVDDHRLGRVLAGAEPDQVIDG
jgi:hypothetical protein